MVDKDENVGNSNRKKILCLFDVDGPLTKSRGRITPEMSTFMESLKDRVDVGLVGGSDLPKIAEQVSRDGSEECLVKQFLFVFAQNGLVAYIDGVLRNQESIVKFVGEEKLQTLINFCLRYLSEVKLPCKRGNFIEFRSGMINVCPVGRSCSQAEREAFAEYDKQHKIREALVEALRKQFGEYGLNFAIGGQISIDIFPQGWDKTYCLQFVSGYQEIHFFGDKTGPGGNDHEIFEHERTIGHTVTSPEHTKQLLTQLFF
jgi:phosphomannomutase